MTSDWTSLTWVRHGFTLILSAAAVTQMTLFLFIYFSNGWYLLTALRRQQDGALFQPSPYIGYPFFMIPDLGNLCSPYGALTPGTRSVRWTLSRIRSSELVNSFLYRGEYSVMLIGGKRCESSVCVDLTVTPFTKPTVGLLLLVQPWRMETNRRVWWALVWLTELIKNNSVYLVLDSYCLVPESRLWWKPFSEFTSAFWF